MHEAVYELNNRAGVVVKWDTNLGRWVVVLPTGDRIFTDIVACGETVVIDGSTISIIRGTERVLPAQVPGLTELPKPSHRPGGKEMVD